MRPSHALRSSLLLLALGAALSASADQIAQTFSIDGAVEQYSYSIPLQAFDSSLGTLTSVSIVLDFQNSGSVVYRNRGAAVVGSTLYAYSGGGIQFAREDATFAGASARRIDEKTGDLPTGGSLTASFDFSGGVAEDFALDDDGNEYQTGTGVFAGRSVEGFVARSVGESLTAFLFNTGSYSTDELSHTTTTYRFDGRLVGSLVYMYDVSPMPVPEPVSFAALGLGAFALVRRRRA